MRKIYAAHKTVSVKIVKIAMMLYCIIANVTKKSASSKFWVKLRQQIRPTRTLVQRSARAARRHIPRDEFSIKLLCAELVLFQTEESRDWHCLL